MATLLPAASPAENAHGPRQAVLAVASERITTLQWAVGIFCGLLGALMLVAPDQYAGPAFAPLQGILTWLGWALVVAGIAVVGTVILGMPRRYVVAAHFLAAAVLLVFGPTFAMRGAWNGLAQYAILGVGTAVSPFVPGSWGERPQQKGDLLAVLIGLFATVDGMLMLLSPQLFSAAIYDPFRPQLPWLGLGFLVAGLAVLFAQFYPPLPRPLFKLAHLVVLGPFLTFALLDPIPSRIWTGIFFHVGFSSAVASLPWAGPRLARIDPRSFSIRLGFTLTLAAALPLMAITAVLSGNYEVRERADQAANQQALAASLASDVSHYLATYRAAASALAGYPGLLDLSPEEQHGILQRYQQAYPGALGFSTRDATGLGIARSDDRPADSIAGQPVMEELKRTLAPVVAVTTSPTVGRPVFSLPAPVLSSDGRLLGAIGVAVESAPVAAMLNGLHVGTGTKAYLVEGTGRVIAHPDQSLVARFADLSTTPPVARALASQADSGVMSHGRPNADLFAAYARVPDFGWTVVVERPASDALAAVYEGRNMAFGLLLVFVALSIVAGSLLARQLSRPLSVLSTAARELGRGNREVSLPVAGSSDVAALATAFGEMRDDLVVREMALRESEARFRNVFDSKVVALAIWDKDGQFVNINDRFLEILGYTRAEFERGEVRWDEAAAAGQLLRDFDHVERLRAGREIEPYEKEFVRRDGTRVPVLIGGAMLPGLPDAGIAFAVDLTESKRAEEERERLLAEVTRARQSLQMVIENAPVAIAVWRGHDPVCEIANSAFRAMVPGKELLGRTVAQIWPELVGQFAELPIRKVLETGEPYHAPNIRLQIRRSPDGPLEEGYFDASQIPLPPDERGDPRTLDVSIEITEQVRARQHIERLLTTIQAERDRLRTLLDSMADEVWFVDASGHIVLINSAAAEGLGLDRVEDAYGPMDDVVPRFEVYDAEGRPRAPEDNPMNKILRGETITDGKETVRNLKTGELRYREFTGAPLRDEKGRIIGGVTVVRDATQRNRAEEALRGEEARLRAVFGSLAEGVVFLNRQGEVVQINDAVERLHGHTFDELTDPARDPRFRMIHPDGTPFPPDEQPAIVAIRTEEPVRDVELGVQTAEGGIIWRLVNAQPVRDDHGHLLGAVASFLDITERKKAEAERERLLAAEQDARLLAEAAVAERDDFLSVAAHELKTPITSLRGYSELLLRQIKRSEALDQTRLEMALARIDQQSERLGHLVNQLLDLSRLEAGKLTLDRSMTDITQLVEDAVELFRVLHPQRKVTIDAPCPLEAVVDPLRLHQVIVNLLDNAGKFSPPGAPIEVGFGRESDGTRITVRDHGAGVPPAHAEKIFDRFHQAPQDWHGGMGLGLFISRQIVELHGGTIHLEGPPDGGSRFVIVLPSEDPRSAGPG